MRRTFGDWSRSPVLTIRGTELNEAPSHHASIDAYVRSSRLAPSLSISPNAGDEAIWWKNRASALNRLNIGAY